MVDVLVIGGGNAALCAQADGRPVRRRVRFRDSRAIDRRDTLLARRLERSRSVARRGRSDQTVLALTYLGGGYGDGCNEADDRFTLLRRRFHHVTFYGFMSCFASTCVAKSATERAALGVRHP